MPGKEVWEVRTYHQLSPELADHLRDGWEPFAVVYTVHGWFYHLRRRNVYPVTS